MVLMIDNFDSFTYNIVHYLAELGAEVGVLRNNALSVEAALALAPTHIVISPGHGGPAQAGISCELVRRVLAQYKHIPLLGICLGMQCIGVVSGRKVLCGQQILHGKTSAVHHHGESIFKGLKSPFTAMRYHSLVVATMAEDALRQRMRGAAVRSSRAAGNSVLQVTAWSAAGELMGVMRRDAPNVVGVQFHPESIISEQGHALLGNFLTMAPLRRRRRKGAWPAELTCISPAPAQKLRRKL